MNNGTPLKFVTGIWLTTRYQEHCGAELWLLADDYPILKPDPVRRAQDDPS